MANKEISELTAATSLSGSELMPISQGGLTRKAALTQLAELAPAGPPGSPGATGPAGPPGGDGDDGAGVLSGVTAPTAGIGDDGDFYLDTSVSRLYGPKATGAWGSGVSLIGPSGSEGPAGADSTVPGPQGPQGDPGPTGPTAVINTDGNPGTTIYVGITDPDIAYDLVLGDVWLDTTI